MMKRSEHGALHAPAFALHGGEELNVSPIHFHRLSCPVLNVAVCARLCRAPFHYFFLQLAPSAFACDDIASMHAPIPLFFRVANDALIHPCFRAGKKHSLARGAPPPHEKIACNMRFPFNRASFASPAM
jgi:hypothetical protein